MEIKDKKLGAELVSDMRADMVVAVKVLAETGAALLKVAGVRSPKFTVARMLTDAASENLCDALALEVRRGLFGEEEAAGDGEGREEVAG
jgi:hypothetical protein